VPVVQALADAHGLRATWVRDEGDDPMASRSDLGAPVARREDPGPPAASRKAATEIVRPFPSGGCGTDDFNNLVQVLKTVNVERRAYLPGAAGSAR